MSRITLFHLSLLGLLSLLSACTETSAVTIGTKLEGESCKQVSDCQAGLDCVEGICTPLPPLTTGPQRGDACQTDADCAPDLFCGRAELCKCTLDSVCGDRQRGQDGTCYCQHHEAQTDAGHTCTRLCTAAPPASLGEACTFTTDCGAPLVCHGMTGLCANGDGSPGTLDLGEACQNAIDCQRPLVCCLTSVITCDDPNRCIRPPLTLPTP